MASGAAVVAIGSDTGGSVRIPASCCGVTGWKPTAGEIPLDGALLLSPSLDTLGLIAREAALIALVAPLVAEALGDVDRAPPPARVLVLGDLMTAAEAPVRRACQDALDALEATGLRLDRRDGARVLEALDPPVLAIMQGEIARQHRWLIDNPSADRQLSRRLAKGLAITDADLERHRAARARFLKDLFSEYLPEGACLALPVMPLRTPPLAETTPSSPSFSGRTLYAISSYTRFANYLGLPAVSVPAGFDDRGLPVGLQLIGRPGSDAALLAAAALLQQRTDWHGRVPAEVEETVTAVPEMLRAGQ